MKDRRAGNSLVEYVIPLALFFAAGLAVMLMADGPQRMVAWFSGTLNASNNGGGTLAVQSYGSLVLPANAQSLPPPVSGVTENVCLGSGMCLTIPVINNGTVSETAGGLGGDKTALMANVLYQIAQQLEEQGEDENLVDLITQLAQNGHYLGYMENTYSTYSLLGMAGQLTETHKNGAESAGHGIVHFKTEYETLWTELQTKMHGLPPDVQAVINMESQGIMDIANGIDTTQKPRMMAVVPNASGSVDRVYRMNFVPNMAHLTHQNADTVCGSGGNTGVCLHNKGDGWQSNGG